MPLAVKTRVDACPARLDFGNGSQRTQKAHQMVSGIISDDAENFLRATGRRQPPLRPGPTGVGPAERLPFEFLGECRRRTPKGAWYPIAEGMQRRRAAVIATLYNAPRRKIDLALYEGAKP